MRHVLIAALAASLLLGVVARTETKPKSTLLIKAHVRREVREKGPDGKEKIKYAVIPKNETAKKDDILVFIINYTNTAPPEDKSSDIIHSIQPGLQFVDASGEGTKIYVSLDRGENWALHPAVFRAKDAQGNVVEKPVPPEAITQVRWMFEKPLKPGQTGNVILKVKVK